MAKLVHIPAKRSFKDQTKPPHGYGVTLLWAVLHKAKKHEDAAVEFTFAELEAAMHWGDYNWRTNLRNTAVRILTFESLERSWRVRSQVDRERKVITIWFVPAR